MKQLFILGANGSIGFQCIEVVNSNKDKYEVVGLSLSYNDDENLLLIKRILPKFVILRQKKSVKLYKSIFPSISFFYSLRSLKKVLRFLSKDTLFINGLSGMNGVKPTIDCLKNNFSVAFANKETLVVKGQYINKLLIKREGRLIPIDSEISSLYQLRKYIIDNKQDEIILKYGITASGGSLRDKTIDEIKNITNKEVLEHPNWKMGKKITIDSATLLNKAFEVIECKEFFDVDIENIMVKQEKTSHIHAFITTNKNTYYFISKPDMKDNILYAISEDDEDAKNHIFTGHNGYQLEDLNKDKFPLFDCCLEEYKDNPKKMKRLVVTSERAAKLFINGKIIYSDLVKYILKKAR